MLGNKVGWLMSVLIALATGWIIVTFGRAPAIARPSGQFANLTAPIKLPVAPAEALPNVMTEGRDAGQEYRAAIQAYLGNASSCDKTGQNYYARRGKLPAI